MGVYVESAKQINHETTVNALTAPGLLIECAETEQKMFEALIELDFAEVYNESGLIYLSEEEQAAANTEAKKSLGKKIQEIWQKFIGWVKDTFNKFIAKVDQIAKGSAAMIKVSKRLKYSEASETELVGADGSKGDFWYSDVHDAYKNFYEKCTADADALEKSADGEVVWNATEMKEKLKNFDYTKSTKKTEKPSSSQCSELANFLGFKSIINEIRGDYTKLTKTPNYGAIKDQTSADMEKKMKVTSALIGFRTAAFNFRIKGAFTTITTARRNYVQIINHVKKAGSKEGIQDKVNANAMAGNKGTGAGADEIGESALLGTMSDLFCESVFGI